jgi:hypothetical protein
VHSLSHHDGVQTDAEKPGEPADNGLREPFLAQSGSKGAWGRQKHEQLASKDFDFAHEKDIYASNDKIDHKRGQPSSESHGQAETHRHGNQTDEASRDEQMGGKHTGGGGNRSEIQGRVHEAMSLALSIPSGGSMTQEQVAYYKDVAHKAASAASGIDASHLPSHVPSQVHAFLSNLHTQLPGLAFNKVGNFQKQQREEGQA